MGKHEKITVHKHGSEYEEPKDLYRFPCCPECFSSNTEVEGDGVISYFHRTGYTYKKRIGIFDATFVYVNHKCNDCSCIFSDEYEIKRKSMKVDDRVALVIILGLVLVMLVFSTVMSTSVEVTGLLVVSWFIGSLVGSIAVGLVFLYCLIDALL